MLRRAQQILGSRADAQEVLQDVFTSLLSAPEQFAGRSSLVTFLYRMTTNRALTLLRSQRNRQRLLKAHLAAVPVAGASSPEPGVELRQLLQRLSEPLAQVAVYYHLDAMTQSEIAILMNCSRQWVSRMLTKLENDAQAEAKP